MRGAELLPSFIFVVHFVHHYAQMLSLVHDWVVLIASDCTAIRCTTTVKLNEYNVCGTIIGAGTTVARAGKA
jgi:hypothetical protein